MTTTLGEILSNDSRFDPDDFLYLPMTDVWALGTKCLVLPESDVDGLPALAQQNGFSYALGIAAVQDVVANAGLQIKEPTPDQLLQAFLFYYNRDAFIVFEIA